MFAWLTKLLNYRQIEDPNVPISSESIGEYLGGGARSPSGILISEKTALTYAAVFRAVKLISKDVAKLPLFVYKKTEDGRERAQNHPAFPILRHKANSEMLSFTFRQTMMFHALLRGNGYGFILRDGDARPLELIPLNPISTYPMRYNGKLWYVTTVEGQQIRELPENVFHLKGLSFDGLQGLSVLSLAAEQLGIGLAAQRHESKFFSNSARPSVVIEHPGTLSEKAGKNLAASWNKMHQGIEQAHKTAVLEEGMQLKPFSVSARDAQFIESREFEIRQVANWFDLPPHKLGDPTRTSFKSLEQENQQYLDDALDGWLVNFEEESRDKLLTEEEKRADSHFVEFQRNALIRTNTVDRYRAYRIGLGGAPFMTINEVRAAETLPSVDDGDEIVMPLNMGSNPDASDESQASRSEDDDDSDLETMNDDQHEAHAELIQSTVGKVIRSLGIHAVRASRKPAKFLEWLDEFSGRNESHVRRTLEPLINACSSLGDLDADELLDRSTNRILGDLQAEMLRVSGECTAKQLEGGISVLFEESVASLGEIIANEILNEDEENES